MGPDHDLLRKLHAEDLVVVVGDKVHFALDNIETAEYILDHSLGHHSAVFDVVANCTDSVVASPAALLASGASIESCRHLHSWVDLVANPNLYTDHVHSREKMHPLLVLAKTGVLNRAPPVVHDNDLYSLSQVQESTIPGLAMLFSCYYVIWCLEAGMMNEWILI